MGSYGTETQQKTVSRPFIIHPSWCTGGCLVHCSRTVAGWRNDRWALTAAWQ